MLVPEMVLSSFQKNFSKYTTLYGFEPNLDEYKKLINFKTDAIKFGIKEPKFKKKKFYNFALLVVNA